MINVLEKTRRVLTSEGMLFAYAYWCFTRPFGITRLPVTGGGYLKGFKNFSEFWMAGKLMPTPSEQALLSQYLRQRGVALDIGANMGVFSLMMGKMAPRVTIHAFEPVPDTFQRLETNIRKNSLKNVHCHRFALSDTEGKATMAIHPESAGRNRLELSRPRTDKQSVNVRSTTIDKFCQNMGIEELCFVKIDVEGAEPRVLAGATDMLAKRKIKCLLVEVCPRHLDEVGTNLETLNNIIISHGYRFSELLIDGTAGNPLSLDQLEKVDSENVLVVPVEDTSGEALL